MNPVGRSLDLMFMFEASYSLGDRTQGTPPSAAVSSALALMKMGAASSSSDHPKVYVVPFTPAQGMRATDSTASPRVPTGSAPRMSTARLSSTPPPPPPRRQARACVPSARRPGERRGSARRGPEHRPRRLRHDRGTTGRGPRGSGGSGQRTVSGTWTEQVSRDEVMASASMIVAEVDPRPGGHRRHIDEHLQPATDGVEDRSARGSRPP